MLTREAIIVISVDVLNYQTLLFVSEAALVLLFPCREVKRQGQLHKDTGENHIHCVHVIHI